MKRFIFNAATALVASLFIGNVAYATTPEEEAAIEAQADLELAREKARAAAAALAADSANPDLQKAHQKAQAELVNAREAVEKTKIDAGYEDFCPANPEIDCDTLQTQFKAVAAMKVTMDEIEARLKRPSKWRIEVERIEKLLIENGRLDAADRLAFDRYKAEIRAELNAMHAEIDALKAADRRHDNLFVQLGGRVDKAEADIKELKLVDEDHEFRIAALEDSKIAMGVSLAAGITRQRPYVNYTDGDMGHGEIDLLVRFGGGSGVYGGASVGGLVGFGGYYGWRGHGEAGLVMNHFEVGALAGWTSYGLEVAESDSDCCAVNYRGVDIGGRLGYQVTGNVIVGGEAFVTVGRSIGPMGKVDRGQYMPTAQVKVSLLLPVMSR